MHIIIGGAHNGKRAYVEKLLSDREHQWIDCAADDLSFTAAAEIPQDELIVIEHIDCWLKRTDLPETDAIHFILEFIKNRQVLFVLTDIGRGIVPMEARQRALRDACGRLYQELMTQADEVTRIWYGLAQKLKKRGEIL